jgi:NitT/TauT family transport system permease protein
MAAGLMSPTAAAAHRGTPITAVNSVAGYLTEHSISVPYAVVAAIVSSTSGVGFKLNQAAGQFDTASFFASIVVLVVMGLLLTWHVTLLERRMLAWKATTR